MTNTYKFYFEATCNQCGKLDKVDLNEAKLQEQLQEKFHHSRGHICVLCELKNTPEQNELYKRTRQAKLWENTHDYIARYLNPKQAWPAGMSGEKMYHELRNADVDCTAISNYSKSMDYLDFLATTHWKVVTARARYEAKYRCRLCNKKKNLNTHHRNYEFRGQEPAHMDELLVLCRECHEKHHGIEEKMTYLPSEDRAGEIVGILLVLAVVVVVFLFAYNH